MRKIVIIICSVCMLLLSFWGLYYAYTPKAGPIGNGGNYKFVWFQFSTQFISGICFLFLGINMKRNNKNS
jgi:hypothetical protein